MSPLSFSFFSAVLFVSAAQASAPIGFNKDIRPILAEACFHCHGPDPASRKASLRLDTEAGFFAARDGEPTVVKGQPEKSALYQRLIADDPDDVMPPKESHKDLKPEQIALIKTWIEQDAPWQAHWAFIKPEAATPPPVQNVSWIRNPIDQFVLANLEKANLKPAAEADRSTLARRVSLDLTGLPPSPEIVETFAKDTSPDAYEKLVDQLLSSSRYGEHRARYWLDAARYADTHGMHFDNPREIWPYRDWVVQAFNRNQPFDQFTVDQLAGDLLPNRTEDQLIATGFQRCNITTNEGGTIDDENLANYAADRVQTVGWVYLGLTVNCAQCHDHKFDPITQKDYYALAAFFRNTTQAPKDGNVKDSAPVLVLPAMMDRPRWDVLPQEIAAAKSGLEETKKVAAPKFDQWLVSAKPEDLDQDISTKNLVAHVPLNEGVGSEVTGLCGTTTKFKATGEVSWKPDGKIGPAPVMKLGGTFDLGDVGNFEKDEAFSYGAWIKAGKPGVYGGILARMDEKGGYRGWDLFQADRSLAVHVVSDWPSDAFKVSTKKPVLKPNQWQHVFVTYNGSGKPGGVKIFVDGEEQPLKVDNDTLKSSIRTTTPMRVGQRSHVQVFNEGSVQDVLVYSRKLEAAEVQTIARVGPLRTLLSAKDRTPAQRQALFDHYLVTRDQPYQVSLKQTSDLEGELTAIKTRSPVTHIQEEKMDSQPMANILLRGQYDNLGEQIPAAAPSALHPLPAGTPGNRLGLAKWIVDPANPLTARVTVNRFWQEIFGTGLVRTADDFGIMGNAPTNPELLDWLAVEFEKGGWDVKQFFKLIVTSSAYRQSAVITPEKLEKDRDNLLFSRGPRFRMDAEMVRDYALAVSGNLSNLMGGPGTKPYQPPNVWEVVGMGTAKYTEDQGEGLYRRTLYNYWKRMAPPANMEVFNAPSREVSCIRRDRTNTPLQALVTLNDPQFIEAARLLAQDTLRRFGNDETQSIHAIGQRILCRQLTAQEQSIIAASQHDLLAHYQTNPDDAKALLNVGDIKADEMLNAASLAAWTMVCNQIMNLDEALNK